MVFQLPKVPHICYNSCAKDGKNLVESMREAKENYRISNSIINTTSSFGGKYREISHNSRIGSNRSLDHGESSTRGSAGYS